MTRIALLRHFQTDWNKEHRLQGRTDRPLTEESRETLHGLALPAPWSNARILSSPLSRAVDTAEILAPDAEVQIDERLTEASWGAWEGRTGQDLLDDPASGYRNVAEWGWESTPPGGESPTMIRNRIAPVLAEIATDEQPAVLVCHRGVMRVVLALAWGWNFDRDEPFRIRRSYLHPLTLTSDGQPAEPGELIALEPRV